MKELGLQGMEFRLKSCVAESDHHIMILPNGLSIADLAGNISIYRDSSLAAATELEGDDKMLTEQGVSIAPFGLSSSKFKYNSSSSSSQKKRIQLIHPEDEEESRLREDEAAPWVIEDEEQRSFVGKLEGGQNSNYVMLVNHGSEFKVIPASKWYKFVPKIQYNTLSLEEAESKMNSRSKKLDSDRWMMRKKKQAEEEAGDGLAIKKKSLMPKRTRDTPDFADEMDFEEVWDDDEGIEILPEDDEQPRDEAARFIGKSRKKLSDKGKEMKKLVRHLDKGNLYVSDEEKDPYADEFDNSDSEEEFHKPLTGSQNSSMTDLSNLPKPIAKRPMEEDQKNMLKLPIKKAKPTKEELLKKRIRSSISIPTSPTLKVESPPPSISDDAALTEDDIVSALKAGPMKTRDLIAKLKPKLAKDPRNKEKFPVLVKKVAIMKGEEKFLELREQFK